MKNIFELTNQEGQKVDFEAKKTSYCKQYRMFYLVSCFILLLTFIYVSFIYFQFTDLPYSQLLYGIAIAIILSFFALIFMLFNFKRFDLIRDFYNEKNIKNKV